MTNVLVAPGEATRHSELSVPLDLNSFRQEDTRWRPIGEVLVAAGAITREELQEALHEQRHSGKRLGEVLIEAGRISWLSLAQAIADQTNASESQREQFVDAAAFAPPTTTETLRRRVSDLEGSINERNVEIAELRRTAREAA